MADTPVLVSTSSHVVEVVINRPLHRNSLTSATIDGLTKAFRDVRNNPNARCVLFTGAGTEAFCAGADLSELAAHSAPSQRRAFFDAIATLIESIHSCPVPIVGVVHGYALAGGCGLAAACDITLAADDAQFGLPEVAIGLAPMVVMAPIARAVGHKNTARLALTAERINASHALHIGLISEIVPKADLHMRARSICDTISLQGPAAIQATKAALQEVPERDYPSFMHELADRSALVSLSAEALEGIQAFTEKRPATWRPTTSTTKS
jgi:methylglutaconyl-CoA hydratase